MTKITEYQNRIYKCLDSADYQNVFPYNVGRLEFDITNTKLPLPLKYMGQILGSTYYGEYADYYVIDANKQCWKSDPTTLKPCSNEDLLAWLHKSAGYINDIEITIVNKILNSS